MASGNRKTLLPDSLTDWHRQEIPRAPSTLPKIPESDEDVKAEVHHPKKHVLEKRLRMANVAESREQELSLRKESPSQKYWTSHKFDQAGFGWISFDKNPGRQAVLIKSVDTKKQGSSGLSRTAHDNIVNLIEAFHSNGMTHLVYNLDLFDIPLSSVHASPTVQLKEEEVATICREVLKGLRYIHEEFELTHGSISISNILLNLCGTVKIANIGEAMMLGKNLGNKREDIKSVGLMGIHLKHPHTTLEDPRDVLHNPPNLSGNAKAFVDMTPTATYQELFQCKFILKAAPAWI